MATKKELRKAIFVFKDAIREVLVRNYTEHGENQPDPELWKKMHSIWNQMNEYCKTL